MAAMIAASWLRAGVETQVHVGNLAWRLASVDLAKPYDDIGLWSNSDGRVVAIALVYESYPIDLLIDPDLDDVAELLNAMLDWTEARWRAAVAAGRPAGPFRVGCFDTDGLRGAVLRRRGYAPGGRGYIRFGREAHAADAQAKLPDGLRARAIDRAADVERMVDLHNTIFDSPVLSVDDFRRVIGAPWYRSELGLIAEDGSGEVVAFALGWIDPVGGVIEFEPVGCLFAWRRRGITRALLHEIIGRAASQGATMATVTARSDNTGTIEFYRATGFESRVSESEFTRSFDPADAV
ncbi:MAG: GNAT family N-acetyltransferase [Rhodospirillales bacterium]|nr:GNAT family N-acetyltransferase [Rhodospirillales bacterium]MDH3790383.1 GNAT family N-acetyltransferase [Rhodospirillales bacterium]MDH3912154.1 GNAT family N-acetyltransferase [Rhodospirillales bacterium]MDH3919595.1 GNAT family N-acetyltransferase [Rhodospirillales bacterium]MDH3968534.1 GNAT family N-acetyltransferase [Rhodospirillales bacterium]